MASEGVSHSHTLYAQLVSKAQSHEHESELFELAQLAGVTMDPEVFKIVLDLLEMKCSPKMIADMLHSMLKHSSYNTATELQPDVTLSHSEQSRNASSSISGQRTSSVPALSSSSAHALSSQSVHNSNSGAGRSSGTVDQSRYSNITARSNSGERRSQGSFSSSHPRLHSGPDSSSSSSYLGRTDNRTRKHR